MLLIDMKHKDKLLHFAVCLITGIFSPMLAVGLALGKEYGDKQSSNNEWCWYDMLANGLGIATALLFKYVYVIITSIFN